MDVIQLLLRCYMDVIGIIKVIYHGDIQVLMGVI